MSIPIPIQEKGFLWDFSVFSQLVIRRPEFEWDMMSMWQRFDGDWLGNSGAGETLRQQLRDEVHLGGLEVALHFSIFGLFAGLGDTIEYIYSIVPFSK